MVAKILRILRIYIHIVLNIIYYYYYHLNEYLYVIWLYIHNSLQAYWSLIFLLLLHRNGHGKKITLFTLADVPVPCELTIAKLNRWIYICLPWNFPNQMCGAAHHTDKAIAPRPQVHLPHHQIRLSKLMALNVRGVKLPFVVLRYSSRSFILNTGFNTYRKWFSIANNSIYSSFGCICNWLAQCFSSHWKLRGNFSNFCKNVWFVKK